MIIDHGYNTPDMTAAFERWWLRYPKKVGKSAARLAYVQARNRGASEMDLLTGLMHRQWALDLQFVPYARFWLIQDRWMDRIKDGTKG